MAFGEQFLTQPATFPPYLHDEPWGIENLIIDFTGGPYLISGLNSEQAKQLHNHFEGSCSSETKRYKASVVIHVRKALAADFREIEEFPWEMTFDLDHHFDYLHVAGLHVMARINFLPYLEAVLWTDRTSEADFSGIIFENIFRMVVTYNLHKNRGMLVHSAGVVDEGCAVLFPGRSNDGKSTLSKLSLQTGRTVLSDDMNALTWVNGRPMLEKVPFSGELGRTWTRSNQYPLKGIFGIHKSVETSVTQMSTSQAVALLVASVPYLNTDLQRMENLLADVHRIAESVPLGTLGFCMEKDFWPEIQYYLKEQEIS